MKTYSIKYKYSNASGTHEKTEKIEAESQLTALEIFKFNNRSDVTVSIISIK